VAIRARTVARMASLTRAHRAKVPTFWFEGGESTWDMVKLAAEHAADRAHVPFHVFVLPDRDHWTAVPPMARLVISKLAALKPGAQLEITQGDVATALAADPL
jgi:hypothetical protein